MLASPPFEQKGCRLLLSEIAKSQGEPIDLFDLILSSALSNIEMFVLGYRYPFGHPEQKRLCSALRVEFMTNRAGSVVLSFPSLARTLSWYLPSSRMARVMRTMRSIEEFASTHLGRHMATLDDKEDRDFIDAYLRKCKKHDQAADLTHSYFNPCKSKSPGDFCCITTMSIPGLQPPPPFLPSPGHPAVPWDQWKQAFQTYMVASGASELPAERRQAILLTCLGMEGQRIFSTLKPADLLSGSASAASP
ncbi:uncharacterized protein LOC119385471 [Rhipicephalus sanguineus]|uniref:uncharacterized protein LOC119385471 n=1 Tax=Rhipicephalus sanguineus TaxID=34632 RepID=UPI0020C34B8A|nr:uncharacterized protein LOC119385471 [Rhipicephalus sanguineus]